MNNLDEVNLNGGRLHFTLMCKLYMRGSILRLNIFTCEKPYPLKIIHEACMFLQDESIITK